MKSEIKASNRLSHSATRAASPSTAISKTAHHYSTPKAARPFHFQFTTEPKENKTATSERKPSMEPTETPDHTLLIMEHLK